jgi:hypothetical protein
VAGSGEGSEITDNPQGIDYTPIAPFPQISTFSLRACGLTGELGSLCPREPAPERGKPQISHDSSRSLVLYFGYRPTLWRFQRTLHLERSLVSLRNPHFRLFHTLHELHRAIASVRSLCLQWLLAEPSLGTAVHRSVEIVVASDVASIDKTVIVPPQTARPVPAWIRLLNTRRVTKRPTSPRKICPSLGRTTDWRGKFWERYWSCCFSFSG